MGAFLLPLLQLHEKHQKRGRRVGAFVEVSEGPKQRNNQNYSRDRIDKRISAGHAGKLLQFPQNGTCIGPLAVRVNDMHGQFSVSCYISTTVHASSLLFCLF